MAWCHVYTPFGEKFIVNSANDDLAGFTGHIEDSATGLTYMQARYYDPAMGRFLSIDPVGFMSSKPYMFNRYAYVGNNPIRRTDPFGMTDDESLGDRKDGNDEESGKYTWSQCVDLDDDFQGEGDSVQSDIFRSRGSCSGRMCFARNKLEHSSPSVVEQILIDHGYGSLSLRGGFIVVGALDVIVTAEGVSVYLGAGLGAGMSATATIGAYAGPDSSGYNIKTTAAGGFGAGANASFRVSEQGVTPSAGLGTGFGASVSTTLGYKIKIKEF